MRMRDRIAELEKELLEAKKVKFFCDKDILTRAMLVTTEEEAKEYKQAYIKYVQKALKDKPRNDNTTAEQIVNSNLGYFSGYYKRETQERIQKLYGASHPIFGSL